MAVKITLEAWARSHFDPPPHKKTLQRWARELRIFPFPEKVGRSYYVDRNARYINPNDSDCLVDRIGSR